MNSKGKSLRSGTDEDKGEPHTEKTYSETNHNSASNMNKKLEKNLITYDSPQVY